MDVVNDVGSMIGINKLDGVGVDSFECFWHTEFRALVNRQFVDAFEERLEGSECAWCKVLHKYTGLRAARSRRTRVALDDHVQLVAVVFALEQRLLVPATVTRQRRRGGQAGCNALVLAEVLEAVVFASHGNTHPACVQHLLAAAQTVRREKVAGKSAAGVAERRTEWCSWKRVAGKSRQEVFCNWFRLESPC